MIRTIAYWYTLIISAVLTFAFLAYFILAYHIYRTLTVYSINWNVLIIVLILSSSTVSTLVAVVCGWRLDRREIRTLERKAMALTAENQELELKLRTAQTSGSARPPDPSTRST